MQEALDSALSLLVYINELPDARARRNCPLCGGIRPEIVFKYEGHNYFFTCWKVKKKNKIIAETDYERMVEYFHSES